MYLWLLPSLKYGRVDYLRQRPYDPQILQYLFFDPYKIAAYFWLKPNFPGLAKLKRISPIGRCSGKNKDSVLVL